MHFLTQWLRRNGRKAKSRRSLDQRLGDGLEQLEGRELLSGNLTAFRLPPAPPGSFASVDSIFRGPTGAVWVAEDVQGVDTSGQTTNTERLYAISRDGEIKPVPVPGNPAAGALWVTASDGSVWFFGSQIGRRNSSGAWTLFPIPDGVMHTTLRLASMAKSGSRISASSAVSARMAGSPLLRSLSAATGSRSTQRTTCG